MKKLFIFTLIFILPLLLISCSTEPVERDISNIYIYHCGGGSRPYEEYKIDFKNNKFTILYRGGYTGRIDEVKKDSPVVKSLSDSSIDEFFEAKKEYGFDNWENEYINNAFEDGHEWGIVIDYSDGNKKEIKGSNAYPETWDEMFVAFENLTGENVLRVKADRLEKLLS